MCSSSCILVNHFLVLTPSALKCYTCSCLGNKDKENPNMTSTSAIGYFVSMMLESEDMELMDMKNRLYIDKEMGDQ